MQTRDQATQEPRIGWLDNREVTGTGHTCPGRPARPELPNAWPRLLGCGLWPDLAVKHCSQVRVSAITANVTRNFLDLAPVMSGG